MRVSLRDKMAPKVFRPGLWYWDRLIGEKQGTIVILSWMFSRPRHIGPYARFYKSCGWDSLICHPHILNIFFPARAAALALNLLNELAKDLEDRVHPIVIAVFSGGHKACLYKFLQILQGKCADLEVDPGKYVSVRRSLVGLVFDSSPVDFVSELGIRLCDQQLINSTSGRPKAILSWGACAFAKTLDFLFYSRFQQERLDLWHTLYSVVNIGPILLLCSENDELAPVETIHKFASNLRDLGGNVTLVSWELSVHVGHFRLYPEDYMNAVKKLLEEAVSVFSERLQLQIEQVVINSEISVLSPEDAAYIEDSQPVFGRPATSWVVLPEATAAKILEVSKLEHFTGAKQEKASNNRQTFTSRNCFQGLKQQSNSDFQEVEELDGDLIRPHEEQHVCKSRPETGNSLESVKVQPYKLLKRNVSLKSRL